MILHDILLELIIFFSIFNVGLFLALISKRMKTNDALEIGVLSVILGIVFWSTSGFLIALFKNYDSRIVVAILLLVSVNSLSFISNIYLFRKNYSINTLVNKKALLAAIGIWFLSVQFIMAITNIDIKKPDVLIDGPYVLKQYDLNVKIQVLNGHLPADNFIPYVVSEFIIRGIDFKTNNPIMPGQSIANRPILMSLFSVPFRMSLNPSPEFKGNLGTFNYVGTEWPDIRKLSDSNFYRDQLLIGIILNSAFILVIFLLGKSYYQVRTLHLILLSILLLSSYYFISQIMFIWPKLLAAFFIMSGIYYQFQHKNASFAGILFGFAYWSHPYALVFFLSFLLYNFIKNGTKTAGIYLLSFIFILLPWIIWTKLYLHLPSDLVSQNFVSDVGFINLVYIRLVHLYEVFTPIMFSNYPFNKFSFSQNHLITLPGALGIFIVFFTYYFIIKYFKEYSSSFVFVFFIPLILIVGVFSVKNVPALHGFQAFIPILYIITFKLLEHRNKLLLMIFSVQFLYNLLILLIKFKLLKE